MSNDLEKALSVAREAAKSRKSILEAHREVIRQALTEEISIPNIQKALEAINVTISLTALRAWIERHEPELYGKEVYRKRPRQPKAKKSEAKPEVTGNATSEDNSTSAAKSFFERAGNTSETKKFELDPKADPKDLM